MKSRLARTLFVGVLLGAGADAFAVPQPVDFRTWAFVAFPPAPNDQTPLWEIAPDGTSVVQRRNAAPSILFGDFESSGLRFEALVRIPAAGPDDDFIGFAAGYDPGSSEFILIDWKATTQIRDGYIARRGLAASRVTGTPESLEFWQHGNIGDPASAVEEIGRGATLGSVGWVHNRTYAFVVEFSAAGLRVFVDGALEIDLAGNFCVGRPGVYAYSQPELTFWEASIESAPISSVVADAGPDVAACPGMPVLLTGSGSNWPCGCVAESRWLEGSVEVRGWSSVPDLSVSPTTDTVYTLEMRCVGETEAADADDVLIRMERDVVVADAGEDVGACEGVPILLSGSGTSQPCGCELESRWLEAGVEISAWSSSSTLSVSPSAPTVYTLEMRCVGENNAADSDDVRVDIRPEVVPPSVGNTLLLLRSGDSIDLFWERLSEARTYSVYRGETKGVWPGAPLQAGVLTEAITLPDVPGPPLLYFYGVVGASCLDVEGP